LPQGRGYCSDELADAGENWCGSAAMSLGSSICLLSSILQPRASVHLYAILSCAKLCGLCTCSDACSQQTLAVRA
jgi:hypothetical protein